MRKGFILSTAFAALLGVGAFAGFSSQKADSKPVEVKADGETIDIYFTKPGSGTYDNAWNSTINLHYWGGSSSSEWPGVDMSDAYINSSGQQVVKASIPSDTTSIIFSGLQNGQYRDQTANITSGVANNKGFYLTGGAWGSRTVESWSVEFYTLAFNANGGTGEMASHNAVRDIDWGVPDSSFTRSGYAFNGWNTKADGSGTSYAAGSTIKKNTQAAGSTLTLYAQWNKTYPTGRYIVGDFGSCEWGMEGAVHMESVNDQYEGQVQLEFGDTFKIAYYNGTELSSYFGYSWILESCGAYHYFSGDGDSDITCYARGTYNFYFTDNPYAEGKKISVELEGSLNAEHLAAKLMGMGEYAGHCGDEDRFPAMKAVYLGLSATEKTVFQGYATSKTEQFKNAYDRYTAWASALGENPWAEGKSANANIVYGLNEEDEGSTVVFIAVAAISALAFATLVLVKKRRHN